LTAATAPRSCCAGDAVSSAAAGFFIFIKLLATPTAPMVPRKVCPAGASDAGGLNPPAGGAGDDGGLNPPGDAVSSAAAGFFMFIKLLATPTAPMVPRKECPAGGSDGGG